MRPIVVGFPSKQGFFILDMSHTPYLILHIHMFPALCVILLQTEDSQRKYICDMLSGNALNIKFEICGENLISKQRTWKLYKYSHIHG